MQSLNFRKYGIFACTSAMAISGAGTALAEEVDHDQSLSGTSAATVNSNLNEWSLLNLLEKDVQRAKGGKGAVVAVIDGKADCTNDALSGRCESFGFTGASYKKANAHATHVSGIIAATDTGIAPRAEILNYAVFADNGYMANGVRMSDVWKTAYKSGARISSMSFNCAGMALCFNSLEIQTMATEGMPMLYVKSAGNNGKALASEFALVSQSDAIAAMERLILVGSVDANGRISGFSNRPGSGCLVSLEQSRCPAQMQWKYHFLVAPGQNIYSTLPGNKMGNMTGTSMAAPLVAGAAALLQARWPKLAETPEITADILLTSATDLGAPGVDDVYGYGLLNIAAAFSARGQVKMVTPSGSAKLVAAKSIKTTTQFSKLASVLGDVTVFDDYGRDYTVAETGALATSDNLLAKRRQLGSRLLGAARQDDWVDAFFAEEATARSFAYFGTIGGGSDTAFALEQSLRLGVDMPFAGGMAQVRLTGAGEARTDFAYDATLRPLAFFASTELAEGAVVSNFQIKTGKNARVMAYAVMSAGTFDPQMSANPRDLRLTENGFAPRTSLVSGNDLNQRMGYGVGYWSKMGNSTVVGLNASIMRQRSGYFTLQSDLEDFRRPSHMFNLGAAASKTVSSWEISASAELTHVRMSNAGAGLAFTPTNMASAELAISKKGVAFSGETSDSLHVAFVMPPRAISGNLQLSYLAPTSDGLNQEARNLSVPVGQLGRDPIRLETAYKLSSKANKWSLSLAGGVNLERASGLAAGEAMMRFRIAI